MVVPPIRQRRRPRHLLRLLLTTACSLAASVVFADVKPDYFAAEKFGQSLKQDFDKRHSAALIERLDSAAMKARVLAPFGDEIANSAAATEMWDRHSFPQFCAQLQSFDEHYTFVPARVALIDGGRWLECALFEEKGSFRLISLRLNEVAGEVRIADFRFSGSEFEATRALRQILILLGLRPSGILAEEEILLCSLSDQHHMRLQEVFAAMGQGDQDRTFARLLDTSEPLQQTRIWRELRNRLALQGCVAAQKHLQKSLRDDGATDPFLRYAMSSGRDDLPRMLADLDAVLAEYHGLAFLRSVRAGLLLNAHRPAEALEAARSVLETNPFSGSAYSVAVTGAVLAQRPEDAVGVLQSWSAIVPVADIEKALRTEAELKTFLDSPRFAAWKTAATASPPAPKP